MTRDEAIKIVARGGLPTDPIVVDAVAFVDILQYLKVISLDEPPNTKDLIREAAYWTAPGGLIEVSMESVSKAATLIGKMKAALERVM